MGGFDDILSGKVKLNAADSFNAKKERGEALPAKPEPGMAVKSKAPTNWDARVQPVIDANGWDKRVNYSNSVHIMKAVNGRYDHMLNNKEIDPDLKAKLSQFKNNAWSYAKELERGGKTDPLDNEVLETYRKNANKLWSEIRGSLDPNKKKSWVVDDKQRIVSRKQFEKSNQLPTVLAAGSGGGEDGFDSDSDPMDAYTQLKGYTDAYRGNIKKKTQPVVGKWLNISLNLLNSDYESANKIDPDNRLNAYKLTTDVLKHIEKHGTSNGDEIVDGQNKQMAVKILGEMRGVTEWKDKLNIIKKYSNVNGENKIADLYQDLGYYGTTHIFNKHRDTLGRNDKYFGGDKKLQHSVDHIDRMNEDYKEFKDSDSKLRLNALNKVKSSDQSDVEVSYKNQIFNSLISEKGSILDFDSWKKNMKVKGNFENAVADNQTTIHIWKEDSIGYDIRMARQLYNNAVKEYKQTFQDIQVPHVFKSTLLKQGLGDKMNPKLRYESVDMSLDKNGNLIKSEGPKAENISKIFNLMKNEDGNVDTEKVTFLNDDLTKNEFANVSKNDLVDLKENNEAVYKDFFKDKKLDDVSVTFVRNASIKHHSAYVLKNKQTGKEMTMIVPQEHLKNVKEPMFENTRLSGNDFTFQLKGKKEIPDREGVYKNAFIREERGQKVAYFKYKNEEGVWEDGEYPIKGDANINQAMRIFDAHINNSLK